MRSARRVQEKLRKIRKIKRSRGDPETPRRVYRRSEKCKGELRLVQGNGCGGGVSGDSKDAQKGHKKAPRVPCMRIVLLPVLSQPSPVLLPLPQPPVIKSSALFGEEGWESKSDLVSPGSSLTI